MRLTRTARRQRCACRRVLLHADETVVEQVGVAPAGARLVQHARVGCGSELVREALDAWLAKAGKR